MPGFQNKLEKEFEIFQLKDFYSKLLLYRPLSWFIDYYIYTCTFSGCTDVCFTSLYMYTLVAPSSRSSQVRERLRRLSYLGHHRGKCAAPKTESSKINISYFNNFGRIQVRATPYKRQTPYIHIHFEHILGLKLVYLKKQSRRFPYILDNF